MFSQRLGVFMSLIIVLELNIQSALSMEHTCFSYLENLRDRATSLLKKSEAEMPTEGKGLLRWQPFAEKVHPYEKDLEMQIEDSARLEKGKTDEKPKQTDADFVTSLSTATLAQDEEAAELALEASINAFLKIGSEPSDVNSMSEKAKNLRRLLFDEILNSWAPPQLWADVLSIAKEHLKQKTAERGDGLFDVIKQVAQLKRGRPPLWTKPATLASNTKEYMKLVFPDAELLAWVKAALRDEEKDGYITHAVKAIEEIYASSPVTAIERIKKVLETLEGDIPLSSERWENFIAKTKKGLVSSTNKDGSPNTRGESSFSKMPKKAYDFLKNFQEVANEVSQTSEKKKESYRKIATMTNPNYYPTNDSGEIASQLLKRVLQAELRLTGNIAQEGETVETVMGILKKLKSDLKPEELSEIEEIMKKRFFGG
ncbi:hypothetical protein O181_068945 [Austropuccinia psidii MF-1]|uniref:Uncharacterized protein n=1 Tax=Austropuccinia psidii MF-1 TaxID=1389203 RepID=A0A9Q3ETI8_9BASI|nr:hypothetical protein [Austropuccinia psidii MF-1]